MVLAQAAEVMSPMRFMLSGNVSWLLAIGVVASACGVVNLVRGAERGYVLAQALLSLVPGVIAMASIYVACGRFAELAAAKAAPTPAELAASVGPAFSMGFFGLGCTLVPLVLAVCALWKLCGGNAVG
ncbi:hypothetical protein KOR34_27290 [Posidoniimonas corsicana]|uniref:Uncharacterized protein n=2 Tax=Posidoniimonas corsicana TaxID=1938618 RepID=A0A5C5VGQ3_9BACT|nr:hypothetical protein KOR34_27290 [Posidoniimonas corsicana]